MPRALSGLDAATRLQTIIESANNHGRGTLYVSGGQVAHRSLFGRLFKRVPAPSRQSIDQFKETLKANYPGHAQKIYRLLESAYDKGRLTTGTVQRVAAQLKKYDELGQFKYVIEYPPEARSTEDKLRFEDERALEVLTRADTVAMVCDYALRLADHIEKSPQITDLHVDYFLSEHADSANEYPVHSDAKHMPKNKAGLVNHLRALAQGQAPDRQVALLSIMWKLAHFAAGTEKLPEAYRLNDIYAVKVKAGKQHTKTDDENAVTRPGTFGNTEIASTLMDGFEPHQKEREAVRLIAKPNARVKKFLKAGYPYISGSSGMANCGSAIFPLLKIDMRSAEARAYGEALAAFIVGAGEHSYPEVYKSLNLSIRHVQLDQALPSANQ